MPQSIAVVAGPLDIIPVRELIAETGISAEVVVATEDTVVSRIQELYAGTTGVAVARGRLAVQLKTQHAIPVIEVILSGQDMADLLDKACRLVGHPDPRIAYVGQRYMFSNPEIFARILHADTDIFYISEDSDLPGVLERAKAAGVECVIGDSVVCEAAERCGFAVLYIGAARDSLLSALRTATRLADALQREQRRRREIQYLIQYSSDAIISLNDRKEIRSVNPRAEKALGRTEAELRGQSFLKLEGLVSSPALLRAFEKRQNAYAIILQFGQTSYVANITALMSEERQNGWLISMQEFAAIDDLDEKIRQERHRRGYTAKAHFADFPAKSPAMRAVIEEAEAYAPYDVPILITGEPRLAKERLAECIHNASLRRRNPYVSVDLGTIPPDRQFDLLFGRRDSGDIGLIGQAHKGTLFLLDVQALTPDCQRQLLSIIRYNNFRRKDSHEPIPVSVRVICSTFVDLMDLARQDRFMWQLANTLMGLTLHMPPVREMPEDIPAYLQEHLESCAAQFKKHITLTDEAIEYLCHYPCPNNLRDIYNFAVRATMLATGPVVDLAFVQEKLLPDIEGTVKANEMHIVADREELAIRRVLKETNNNRNLAAETLGISRSTLWRKIKKYNIE